MFLNRGLIRGESDDHERPQAQTGDAAGLLAWQLAKITTKPFSRSSVSGFAKSGYCTPHLVERCPKDRFQNFLKAFASLDLLGKEAKRGKRPNNPRAYIPGRPSCSKLRGSRLLPLKAGTQTQAGRLRTSSPHPAPGSKARLHLWPADAPRGPCSC